jgi:hypothetical protein
MVATSHRDCKQLGTNPFLTPFNVFVLLTRLSHLWGSLHFDGPSPRHHPGRFPPMRESGEQESAENSGLALQKQQTACPPVTQMLKTAGLSTCECRVAEAGPMPVRGEIRYRRRGRPILDSARPFSNACSHCHKEYRESPRRRSVQIAIANVTLAPH